MKFIPIKKRQIGAYLIIGYLITSCAYTQKKSLALYTQAAQKKYDVIVVPGVPFENGSWSQIMRGRILWSKLLLEKGITENIMFSGSAVYTPYVESEIMAEYAKALEIPEGNIYTEEEAEHSTENIYYSYKKAKALGFEKIALASDPFQTKMLSKFARKRLNNEVGVIPFVFDTLATMHSTEVNLKIDYLPMEVKNFVPITEREGFWKRFRGTRGKNIDFEE